MALERALIFFLVSGIYIHENKGHYNKLVPLFAALFFWVVTSLFRREKNPEKSAACKREPLFWAWVSVLVFAFLSAIKPRVIYAEAESTPWLALRVTTGLQFLLAGALVWWARRSDRSSEAEMNRFERWGLGASVVLALIAQLLVIPSSPKPFIDVWQSNMRGIDFFLAGLNPYAQAYPDIYGGTYDYKPGFLYFPGVLYWGAPFRWLFGDIRYGSVFANLLAAAGFWRLGRGQGASSRFTAWMVLAWLLFPVTFFVIEQNWTDALLVPGLVWLYVWLTEGHWTWAGAVAGWLIGVKQYAFLAPMLLFRYLFKEAGWRGALRATVAVGVVAAAVLLPFVVWDFASLRAMTFDNQANPQMRRDALTVTAWFARLVHWQIPNSVTTAAGLLAIAVAFERTWRAFKPTLSAGLAAVFFAYGAVFFFGKWAFCNYYYLHASFGVAYILASDSRKKSHRRHAGLQRGENAGADARGSSA